MKKPDGSCAQNSGNEMEGKRGGDSGQDDLEMELENLIKAAVKEEDEERWEAIQKELEEEGPFEYSAEEEKEMEARISRIRKMGKKESRKEKKKKHRVLRVISASAAVLVLAVVVQSAIVKSVDASIETVVDVVVKWFEDHVEIKNEVSEYWTTKYDIEPPEYIPEGYELIDTENTPMNVTWKYSNDNNKEILINCTSAFDGMTEFFNPEVYSKEKVMIGTYDGMYWKSLESSGFKDILRWNSNEISFRIEANISLDEMIKIAQSLMKKM